MSSHFLAASSSNPLIPHWPELIIGTIAFLIVFILLARVLMPRISKTLEERSDAIEGGLKRAETAQTEANKVLDQYRSQLADARQEAAQLVAQGRAEGAAERERIIATAAAQVDADRQQALHALRAEVGTLAVELASKIVGESLADEARQSRMVDRFLADLEGTGAAAR